VGYRGLPAEILMVVLVGAAVDAEAHSENSLPHLLAQSLVLARRLLIRWVRNPLAIVHALLLPVAFLLTLKLVFADSITSITGQNALYRSVPLVALVAGMAGSSAGVVGITAEYLDGFLARLWALPIHRVAGLLSRLAAETIRLLGTTLVILGTGVILGFRFHRGAAAALLWVAVPVIFGVAFSALVTTAILYWRRALLVEAMQPVVILGATFCTGFVPLEQYPGWVQPLVRDQPMSSAVDAMRGLSVGGPVLWPMISALVWSAAIFAACLWPIMVGYRRASTSR
jgi:ABC-2 type transport system permease protein